MNASIFILCAGDASRFDGIGPKQLLPWRKDDSESILARTAHQVRRQGFVPCVVTGNPEILRASHNPLFPPLSPEGSRWTCETAFSTRRFWKGEFVAFLLGDVCWTHDAIAQFLNSENVTTWCGDDVDIFGLRFPSASWTTVSTALRKVVESPVKPHKGRLRDLWGSLYGKNLLIKDGTMDVDTMADHNRLLNRWGKRPAFVHPSNRGIAKG
jgi:hypothetical protein